MVVCVSVAWMYSSCARSHSTWAMAAWRIGNEERRRKRGMLGGIGSPDSSTNGFSQKSSQNLTSSAGGISRFSGKIKGTSSCAVSGGGSGGGRGGGGGCGGGLRAGGGSGGGQAACIW